MKNRWGLFRITVIAAAALVASAICLRAQAPAASPTPTPSTSAPESATHTSGTPVCADCHEAEVKAFASNPHARWSSKDPKPGPEDACSTCHGDGTKHMEASGDKYLIGTMKGVAGSQDCLSCHQNDKEHTTFSTGFHSNTAAVNCLSCHSIHKSAPKSEHLLAKAPTELCATCHATESASFRNKPYAHRLDRGVMTCLDCHDPHNRKGEKVKLTVQGELPCLNCHAEKRGPFVFTHVTGSGGDCLSCHQPHGSNNPNSLLWAQVSQLCLSCHSQTGGPRTFGSQPPSFHNLALPRYRNCTSCHTAVHGSNLSPQLLK